MASVRWDFREVRGMLRRRWRSWGVRRVGMLLVLRWWLMGGLLAQRDRGWVNGGKGAGRECGGCAICIWRVCSAELDANSLATTDSVAQKCLCYD